MRRPASVIQVAAALPRGDPLAAAIAARETPSPEMVAAAWDEESLSVRAAWATAVVALLLAAAAVALLSKARLLEKAGFRKSPEVMSEHSREVLGRLGYSEEPADSAFGFSEGRQSIQWLLDNDSSVTRWDRVPSDALLFWYRQSPRPMAPEQFNVLWWNAIRVQPHDPPINQTGMALIFLDAAGHLERLQVVPPQRDEMARATRLPNWGALFREAGLDLTRYASVPPEWSPPTFADTRAAWTGPHPDRPHATVRIEAAAYGGRPVSFLIVGPWDYPELQAPYRRTTRELLGLSLWYSSALGGILATFLGARRNIRLGRGDRKGAWRVAGAVGGACLLSWAIGSSHTATEREIFILVNAIGNAVLNAAIVAALYLTLEPFIRRRWPQTLVSWSRLLTGHWRDPAVGRNILVGIPLGIFSATVAATSILGPGLLGWRWGPPISLKPFTLEGFFPAASTLLEDAVAALGFGFAFLFFFTALRVWLRREWLAATVMSLFFGLVDIGALGGAPIIVSRIAAMLLFSLAVTRFGFLSGVVFWFVSMILKDFPVTLDAKAWWAGSGALALATVALLLLWGAKTASSVRPQVQA